MSLEMALKVIVPPKKIISRSFLNSGTLIVITDLSVCYGSWGFSIGFSVKGTVWPDLNRLEVVRLDSPSLVQELLLVCQF
jgi:hypothetical protein